MINIPASAKSIADKVISLDARSHTKEVEKEKKTYYETGKVNYISLQS